MDDELVEVMSGLSPAEAGEVELLLASMGIHAISRIGSPTPLGDGDAAVFTAPEDVPRVRRLLAEEFPEGRPFTRPTRPAPPSPVPRARGGRAAVAGLLVVMGLWFASLNFHATPTRADFLRHGAIAWTEMSQGQVWRYAAALFVHFDALHLLANAAVFLVVGLPLADLVGPLRFVAIFFCTGLAGNVTSHLLSPSLALKGGASGAVAGLLGALAGQQLRPDHRSRYRAWQVLGALAAVYALLVGTGPGRDDIAHLGGLLSGILVGRLVSPRGRSR